MADMTDQAAAWRLGYKPALDGVRAIAVLLTLASHVGVPGFGLVAGQVGVTMFFTLSGFLIATLLCEERERAGRVSLRSFYVRRARRLLPALVLVVVTAAGLTISTGFPFVNLTDVLGALFYCSNIVGLFVPPHGFNMLHHTWSLVLEEQFYVCWPAVMLVSWNRRRLLINLVLVGAALSLAFRVHSLMSIDLASLLYGTGSRIEAILIGCALALIVRSATGFNPITRVIPLIGLAACLLVAVATVPAVGLTVGLTIVALGTSGLILGALADVAPDFLVSRLMLGIGRRSYGLYLWQHIVLIFSFKALGTEGDWIATSIIVVPVSGLLTLLSWRYVEQPFLRNKKSGLRLRRTVASGPTDPFVAAVGE